MLHFIRYSALVIACGVVFAGCMSPYPGIKIRAQAPNIEEAFRKMTLALSVDRYEVESIDMKNFTMETKWREIAPKEMTTSETALPLGSVASRISLKIVSRGSLYDVLLTPWVRYTERGEVRVAAAGVRHPLREKWEKAIKTLLEKEVREED